MSRAVNHFELSLINEVGMMSLPVEQVNFIFRLRGHKHTIFDKMIVWSFPLQLIS